MRELVVIAALAALAPMHQAWGGDPAGDPIATSGGARWGANYFPNVELVTQHGQRVHFFDDLIAGKVVVINFIYTNCPDACPLETAKLAEVYQILGQRVGSDVFFYSISIDPERDTPEVLREYAERYQAGQGWLFLTGAPADIKLVRQKMGMLRTGEEALQDHSLSLMIGNQATGTWMKRSAMENPYLLATQVGSWLSNWKLPPEPGRDYADAPKLRDVSRGESLFRTRCSVCHLIGPDDGLVRQGPNLLGVVERRERAWLSRWLTEPDVMLAEKDPIAIELMSANRNLPMPNMRLNRIEVEALLAYMGEESARLAAAQRDVGAATASGPALHSCCQKESGLVLGDEEEADVSAAAGAPEAPSTAGTPASRSFWAHLGVGLAIAISSTLCLGLALALGIASSASRAR